MLLLRALNDVRGVHPSRRIYTSLSASAEIIKKARFRKESRNKESLMSQTCSVQGVALCSPLIS